MLAEQWPRVEILSLMQVSGTTDFADPGSAEHFTSRNEDRISVGEVPLLTPADLVTLPKGQAFALFGLVAVIDGLVQRDLCLVRSGSHASRSRGWCRPRR